MKIIFILILALFAAVAVARPFSLSCTAECAAYYTCYARAAFTEKQPNCQYPSRCDCKKPFWMSDVEEESDRNAFGLFTKMLVEHMKENKAIQNVQDGAAGADTRSESDADFSVVCTAKCAQYYVCKAKGAWKGDYSECSSPSGCDCTKFAWQKDEEESDFFFFKKSKKNKKPKQPAPVEQPAPAPAVEPQPAPVAEPAPESDAEFLRKLLAFFQKKKKPATSAPVEQPAEVSVNEPFKPIEEESDQALDKIRAWFTQKIASVKRLFNKNSTQSDRMLPSRCFCIRAPCNCNRYVEQADQFLSNLKKWFDSKIAAIKQAVSQNASQSDLSIARFPIKRPTCMCIRAPCNCGKWLEQQDISFLKVLKQMTKDGKFPTKKLVEGLKSQKFFKQQDN